jgi:hypothetical protein
MIVKVKDDSGHTIGKHHPKSFAEFEEIAFQYREKFG